MFARRTMTTAHSLAWTLFLRHSTQPYEPTLPGNVDPLGWWVFRHSSKSNGFVYGTNDQREHGILPASSYSQRITATPGEKLGHFNCTRRRGSSSASSSRTTSADLPDPEAFLPDRWLISIRHLTSTCRLRWTAPVSWRLISDSDLKNDGSHDASEIQAHRGAYSEVSGKVISTMLGPTTT